MMTATQMTATLEIVAAIHGFRDGLASLDVSLEAITDILGTMATTGDIGDDDFERMRRAVAALNRFDTRALCERLRQVADILRDSLKEARS